MTKNHFTILGLKPGVTDDDVKKAYRTLAKKYHPDKNKSHDAEEKFKEIGAAYEVLKAKDRREIHERELNRPKEAFVRTEFRTPGGRTQEHNYRAKEEFNQRRRSEPPPRFKFDEDPFTGPYSQYRNSKGFKEKDYFDHSKQKQQRPAGKKRPQEKPKWNNNWTEEEEMSFHDYGDKSSFSFAFKSFMDDMDFSMSFTMGGDMFGEETPFTNFNGHGPGPKKPHAAYRHHKNNVAGEHGYKGGLSEDYLFSPRSGMDSSESESEDSDDSDFDYSDMKFSCAFCGKRLKLEDLKTHEPACGHRKKTNINIDSDDEEHRNGYRKMFQDKSGDWRRDHEKFQEYVKRAKRAYRINKSRDGCRMESQKLLCSLCGKVIEKGEARTHSLFCHTKADPHFGPPPTTNEDPPMKDSKYKRAKEYAKKKVPKFKKSFSADDPQQQHSFTEPKTKGRDTMDEPMTSSGTGLNPSPKSKFGKTKRAPAPPPPKPCPSGPTVGPAPTTTSSRTEEPTKTKLGHRASCPPAPQSNPTSSPAQDSPPVRPSSQLSRKEDVPVKVGTYQLVRTRYVVATKPPIYSESDTSSEEESDSDSDNDQQLVPRSRLVYVVQPRVVVRPRPTSEQLYPQNIKVRVPVQNPKNGRQQEQPKIPEKPKKSKSFRIGKK
ncbi:uncharacterized protein LOC127701557 isoform X2 [Mytilus californianus]|uniref:uncharacterized protein LOC127701557 isoform X2 n=1 Tax=Mytilus californianus TaxID=6549 RepID=UPI002246FDB9|nr:uncharacterized protein LOC127701557 isoform X2 [Mytilus californianus]